MNLSAKKLAAIFTTLFIIGAMFSAWTLFKLPEDMVNTSNVLDLDKMQFINPLLAKVNLVVGVTTILGILSIITFVTSQKNEINIEDSSNQLSENQNDKDEKVENEEEMEEIFKGVDLDQINLMLAEKEDNKLKLNNVLNKICNHIEAVQGALYVASSDKDKRYIELIAAYAYHRPESEIIRYEFGEGLAGQVAKEGKLVNINEVPSGYIKVISGLGDSSPNNLLIIPLKKGDKVIGVAEIASFKPFRKADISYLEQVFSMAAEKTISGNGAIDNSSPAKKNKKPTSKPAKKVTAAKAQKPGKEVNESTVEPTGLTDNEADNSVERQKPEEQKKEDKPDDGKENK